MSNESSPASPIERFTAAQDELAAAEQLVREHLAKTWNESLAVTTDAVRAFAEAVRAARAAAKASLYAKRDPNPDHAQRVWNHACTAVLAAESRSEAPDPMVIAAVQAVTFLRVDPK